MVTKFSFVGGALCLDFVNTVGGHDCAAILRDKFTRVEDMRRWASLAGVSPAISAVQFRRGVRLREALFRILRAAAHRKSPAETDLALFNQELGRVHHRMGYRHGAFHLEAPDALAAILKSATDLLTSPGLARVKQCGGEGCGWLFLDTSRNGSRHWCDMAICGNREKARKFRRKTRQNKRRET